MATKKQLEKKKKEREEKAKARVLSRREKYRKIEKHKREVDRIEHDSRHRLMPIVNPEKKEIRIKSQLEHNMEILKALEQQYETDQANKKQLNTTLEEEGHETFKEKMDAMEQFKNKELGIDSTFDYEELKSTDVPPPD